MIKCFHHRPTFAGVAAVGVLMALSGSPASAAQVVSTLTLMNADTNQPVAGFDPLPSGAVLDLSQLPTRNLNIRANTSPTTVGSVRFALDGNGNYRTETAPPYALAGDTSGNFWAWAPSVGSHSITVTPYTGPGATGSSGTALTVSFSVRNGSTGSGSTSGSSEGFAVTSLTLINADTNHPVSGFDPLTSGAVLDYSTLPTHNLNIRANTSPATVGSVHFRLDSTAEYRTETGAPYALAGDSSGNYTAWTPSAGAHTVVATPYQLVNGKWTTGTVATVTFTVQDPGNQVCK